MHVILLSGGGGRRLWPLSNDIRAKQFIPVFPVPVMPDLIGHPVPQGTPGQAGGDEVAGGDVRYESMLQRICRQIREVDPGAQITVATGAAQAPIIREQLGEGAVGISIEPCRRDTFPAIALATAYLHDVQGAAPDDPVVVCPVDPYVDENYFQALKRLADLAAADTAKLVLMGMAPTCPSEKFGYIIPKTQAEVAPVETFKEKPTPAVAEGYIAQGALWNGGVFAYKLGYVLDRAHELIDFKDYQDLFAKYDGLTRISFDYAVVEHEPDIAVLRFAGRWQDIGTWDALTEALDAPVKGPVTLAEDCSDVRVINETKTPVLCVGLKDVIVSVSQEGILVCARDKTATIKPYVDAIVDKK